MTATIHQLRPERRLDELMPQIPSMLQMTTELLRDHVDDLNLNELTIVHYARQLAELGRDSPMYLQYVHRVYLRFNRPALTLRQRLAQFFIGRPA